MSNAPTTKRTKSALFICLQFLIKDFFKIIWLVGFKCITLHADTGNDSPNELKTKNYGKNLSLLPDERA